MCTATHLAKIWQRVVEDAVTCPSITAKVPPVGVLGLYKKVQSIEDACNTTSSVEASIVVAVWGACTQQHQADASAGGRVS